MGAIANTIAIVVIVCVGYLIIKKVYPTAVLMIAGLVLLCCAVLLDVEPGLALKKGTGSEFFDIFKTCKSSKDHSKPRNEVDTSLKSPV